MEENMSKFDAIILLNQEHDPFGQIWSGAEIGEFLVSKKGYTIEEADVFLHEMANFWTEADVISEFFKAFYDKKTKEIPEEPPNDAS